MTSVRHKTVSALGTLATETETAPLASAMGFGAIGAVQHPLVTSDSWTNTVGGNWATGTNWSTGSAPTSSTAATIAATGNYNVRITATAAVQSLSMTDAGANVTDTSTLSIGTTLTLSAGVFDLASGGNVVGGTITTGANGDFQGAGGVLSGVAYLGILDLTNDSASVTLTSGDIFAGAGGSGAATIDLTTADDQSSSYLYVAGSATINNVTIDIGDNTSDQYYGRYDYLVNADETGGGAVLTLGAGTTINQTGVYAAITSSDDAGDAIINQGVINVGFNTGSFLIDATHFTNPGTIVVSGGDTLEFTGSIAASLIDSVTVGSGGVMAIAGTVSGGTITVPIYSAGGTLSGVALHGTLNMTGDNTSLTLTNGDVFAGAGGSGAATIDLTTADDQSSSYLYVAGSTTLNNVTVDIGDNTGGQYYGNYDELVNQDKTGGGAVLTLGAGATIDQTGVYAAITSSDDAGDAIINQGVINAGFNTGVFLIDATHFTNSGTIAVSGGDTLKFSGSIAASLIDSVALGSGGEIAIAGTVAGGTITVPIYSAGGTLSGVALQGTLNMTADNTSFTLTSGDSFAGAGGSGAGVIDLMTADDQRSSNLYVDGTATLNDVTLNIGDDNGTNGQYYGNYDDLVNQDKTGGGAVLTLGTSTIIDQTGVYAAITSSDSAGDAIINQGIINAGFNTGTFLIDATHFTNSGTIVVSGGDTLEFSGSVAASLIDSVALGSGGEIAIAGTVAGGTITVPIYSAGGTLSGVALQGTLNMTADNTSFTLTSGDNFAGAGGSGAGVIDLMTADDQRSSNLYVDGTATLNNLTLNIGDGNGTNGQFYGNYDELVNQDTAGTGAVLTLGTSTTIDQAGVYAGLSSSNLVGDAIINAGNIDAGFSGGSFVISAPTFTNTGSLTAANGDTLSVQAGNFTNLSAGTLTGGSYASYAGSAIQFVKSSAISTDQADIILYGANSSLTIGKTALDNSLSIIATGGTLSLQSGRNFTATANSGTFTDSGLLSLGAGTLTATSLSITPVGKLLGNGSVAAALSNSGSIEANGGTLLVGGLLTGTGGVQIDAGAALEAGGSVAATETLTFGGIGSVLKIDAAAGFAGSLANLAGGDVIDFANTTLTQVSTSGTSLLAVSAAGTTTLTLAAPLAALHLALGTDGNGGTDITAYNLAQAGTHTPEPLAFGNHHVGDVLSSAITLTNSAPTGGFSERLDAIVSGESSNVSASGTIFRLGAGFSSGSLTLGLSTATAGAISGSATLALTSDGGGIDGLGDTGIGSQIVNVTGAIYAYATAVQSNGGTTILANTHVGQTATGFLTLKNAAASGAYSEALDANLTGPSSGLAIHGTLTGLAGGASNSDALALSYATANAGAYSATAILHATSDGTNIDGLGTTVLANQKVTIKGSAYAYAKGIETNGGIVALANTHVGQAASGFVTLTNGALANGYSEALDATLATSAAGFTAGGAVLGLAAGLSSSTLQVGHTATAGGAYSGLATLGLVSDGNGIDGLGTTTLTSQSVTITGAAYAYAVGAVASANINLGVVHVGDTAASLLSLSNSAVANGYSEALDAAWGTAGAGVLVSGSANGIAAGSGTSALSIGLATSASGSFAGTALLDLTSDGTGIDGLGTTALAAQTITVTGIVDNYALAAFDEASSAPAITGSGTSFALNLGTLVQGGAAASVALGAMNAASGLSDLLLGSLTTAGGAGFTNAGFGAFAGLGAGQGELSQSVTLTTGTAGVFSETILLSSAGTNASGYDGALATETLTITGTVVTPSSNNTYTLATGPNTVLGAAGGDLFIAAVGAINSRDSITGGSGSNTLQLTGGGVFDLDAPRVLANIQTIVAAEGQAGVGTGADGRQTVYVRDGVNQAVHVVSGTAAHGNTNPETITLYDGSGNNAYTLGTGADALYLSTGNDTVVLGGSKNSVVAGGGMALIKATAAVANASVVGTSAGSSTLEITNAGTVTLNAADTDLTVQLDAAARLILSKMAFITANGSNGGDNIAAGAANQTLIGGAADLLTGYSGGGDSFVGASGALNGDTIGNWTTGDVVDLTDMSASATLSYVGNTKNGKLTVSDGTHKAVISFSGSFTVANFASPVSDGHGGALIGYHM